MLFNIFLFCVFYGSSVDGVNVDECYGRSFSLPYEYTPPLYKGPVYFTPRNGGPRKLLLDNGQVSSFWCHHLYHHQLSRFDIFAGQDPEYDKCLASVQAKDPTVSVSIISVTIKDLRQSGTFSGRSTGRYKLGDVILEVLDCARKVTRPYRHAYTIDLPTSAEFLEYTLDYDSDENKVLWNRSDPQSFKGDRGKMTSRGWDFITLTQEDNGYYSLRKKDKTLVDRIRLTVEENSKFYDPSVGDVLLITNPYTDDPWTVTFLPVEGFEKQILMEDGYLVAQDDWRTVSFSGRIQLRRKAIEIGPVEITDSGTFEYRDPRGNLAQVVKVEVNPEPVPTYVYVAMAGGIVLAVILCCCCVRKCCCKKGSSKRDESAPAAVYYHDQDQPAGQSNAAAPAPHHSYHSVNPPASRQPAASVHNPVNIHTTPLQPEVPASGGQGAAPAPSLGSDCLSSEPPPVFELKGLTFPSATPLGSESTISDVYTSDKLNFL